MIEEDEHFGVAPSKNNVSYSLSVAISVEHVRQVCLLRISSQLAMLKLKPRSATPYQSACQSSATIDAASQYVAVTDFTFLLRL